MRPWGGVVGADEGGELAVGREDLGVDGLRDGGGEAGLVGGGDGGGVFFGGQQKRVRGEDAVALAGDLFGDEADGHEAIRLASAHDLRGLLERARDEVEAGEVVLVVLDGVEGHALGEVGEAGVDAVLLVDGDFVGFEGVGLVAEGELADQQLMAEAILFGHAVGGDGFEAGEVGVGLSVLAGDGGEGDVGEAVVVAVVADGGGLLGVVAKAVLVEVFKQGVLGGDAGRQVCPGGCGGRGGGQDLGGGGGRRKWDEEGQKEAGDEAGIAHVTGG